MARASEVTCPDRRARRLLVVGAVVTLLGAPGCGDFAATEGASPFSPPLGYDAPTTDGVLALANLHASIGAQEDALARRPDLFAFRKELVSALLARASYAGIFDDLDRADALTAEALEHAPTAEAHLLRAQVLARVHRFVEAEHELDDATAKGAADVGDERGSYLIAQGRGLHGVLTSRREAAERTPSFSTLADLATAEAAVGRFARADELYREALGHYRDVSPFPVAWVFFQRGVMWAELAGQREWARPFYEEAVRRLPGYVSANVHLAELELSAGESDTAVARLDALLAHTTDPEPAARLSQWVTDPPRARRLAAAAGEGYQRLLSRHPLAFLDHASEFYAAGEDPARGLALAEENLLHRRNGRAFLLVLQAADAAGRPDRLCAVSSAVPAAALAGSVPLAELVAATRQRCR